MKNFRKISFAIIIAAALSSLQSCGPASYVSVGVQYQNPSWAPPYYSGVRYYYLPDIEAYYDLSNRDFAYMDNGQWLFSPVLPSMYSGYDLSNGFVVALNFGVFQPWMHHQYYVSHYPRYYYRNVYGEGDIANIRGFNENERKPFYWKPEDRNHGNIIQPRNNVTERKPEMSRQPQKTNYYGKTIGQPVKVRQNMRENKKGNKGNGRNN